MLSCSLDPDQDLKSGSKLFTWYDVCCNIGGGGGYVLVVKFSRGHYVLVVKFTGGDYVLVVKFMGGILSRYTKMSRGVLSGGGGGGGFCPTLAVGPDLGQIVWNTYQQMSSADKVIVKVKRKNKTLVQLQLVITSKVSKSLDPYQVRTECGPVLGPNYLKGLSADGNVM